MLDHILGGGLAWPEEFGVTLSQLQEFDQDEFFPLGAAYAYSMDDVG